MKRCFVALQCFLVSCALPPEGKLDAHAMSDWQALMADTEAVQLVDDHRFDCTPFTEPFFLRVSGDEVAGFMQADENHSFRVPIDRSGRFRATMPTNSVYTYSDAQVQRQSRIVLVLQGRLSGNSGSGLFVIGDTALDAKGCATKVQFIPV